VRLPSTGGRVAVLGGFGIGGPAAAARLEEFIALGTRRYISVGTAGSIQPDCNVGDVVVASGPSATRASPTTTCRPERSAIPSGRQVPLVEPLATVARSRSTRVVRHLTGVSGSRNAHSHDEPMRPPEPTPVAAHHSATETGAWG
jgi:uridine phosphorylase